MSLIKLNQEQKQKMLNLPETGMGYQRVDITLADGSQLKNQNVFNGTILQTTHPYLINSDQITDIKLSK